MYVPNYSSRCLFDFLDVSENLLSCADILVLIQINGEWSVLLLCLVSHWVKKWILEQLFGVKPLLWVKSEHRLHQFLDALIRSTKTLLKGFLLLNEATDFLDVACTGLVGDVILWGVHNG